MHDLTMIMVNYQVNVLNSVLFRIKVIRPVLAQPKTEHKCLVHYPDLTLHVSKFTVVLAAYTSLTSPAFSFNTEQINTNQQTAEQQR